MGHSLTHGYGESPTYSYGAQPDPQLWGRVQLTPDPKLPSMGQGCVHP